MIRISGSGDDTQNVNGSNQRFDPSKRETRPEARFYGERIMRRFSGVVASNQ